MSTDASRADILKPLRRTTRSYYLLLAAVVVAIVIFLVAYGFQLQRGMVVTGLGDWGSGGGVTWGLYIGAFIWWVGIAHGGIILSAAVRLFGMKRYRPVARMAELLTIFALTAAGIYIVLHVGRPDRIVVSVLLNYPETVLSSPLVWDVTVITLYFVLTATYLGLTLRSDIMQLRSELPDRFEPLYRIITVGYTEAEDEIVERMVWWLAVGLIVLAPLLLHGGVIPWLFALVPSMPGWFGAVQGPQFLTIALTSAIGGVIVITYVFRKVYDWGHILTDDVVRGLTLWLGLFGVLFTWLQLQQVITGVFSAPLDLSQVTYAMLTHSAYIYALGVMVLVLAYIFAQAIEPSNFTLERSVIASVAVLSATLAEKVLFVVEGMMYPSFDLYAAAPGEYFPSLIELASVLGTIGIVTLLFMLVIKVIPVIELHAIEDPHTPMTDGGHDPDRRRNEDETDTGVSP